MQGRSAVNMGGTIILEVSEAGFVGEWRKKNGQTTKWQVLMSDMRSESSKLLSSRTLLTAFKGTSSSGGLLDWSHFKSVRVLVTLIIRVTQTRPDSDLYFKELLKKNHIHSWGHAMVTRQSCVQHGLMKYFFYLHYRRVKLKSSDWRACSYALYTYFSCENIEVFVAILCFFLS